MYSLRSRGMVFLSQYSITVWRLTKQSAFSPIPLRWPIEKHLSFLLLFVSWLGIIKQRKKFCQREGIGKIDAESGAAFDEEAKMLKRFFGFFHR